MRHLDKTTPSRFTHVTLGVEYERHSAVYDVANDLESLGFPSPSQRDIELKATGNFRVTLRCLPSHLQLIQSLERGREADLNVKKSRCGIKRIWSMTRFHVPYLLSDHKRPFSEVEDPMPPERRKSGTHTRLQHQIRESTSPSSFESSSPSYESTKFSDEWNASPTDDRTLGMICEPAPSPISSTGIASRSPERFLLKIQPLDQSYLPTPQSPESVMPSTRDPRRRLSLDSVLPSSVGSPIDEECSGYDAGTSLVHIQTGETRACGSDARMRRLLFFEKIRGQERVEEVERERDELRTRVQTLEQERTQACEELKYRRSRCRMLEIKMDDVRKECMQPFVVPALLDAFFRIGEFDDKLLEDQGLRYH